MPLVHIARPWLFLVGVWGRRATGGRGRDVAHAHQARAARLDLSKEHLRTHLLFLLGERPVMVSY